MSDAEPVLGNTLAFLVGQHDVKKMHFKQSVHALNILQNVLFPKERNLKTVTNSCIISLNAKVESTSSDGNILPPPALGQVAMQISPVKCGSVPSPLQIFTN